MCRSLAAQGRTFVAIDLGDRDERIEAFTRETAGLDIHFAAGDVSDFDACGRLVEDIVAAHGALDILVNAAGITLDTTLRKMQREQWDAVLRVNLDVVFNLCRHAVDGIATRGFGRIVYISSVTGQTGHFGQTKSATSKAGLPG